MANGDGPVTWPSRYARSSIAQEALVIEWPVGESRGRPGDCGDEGSFSSSIFPTIFETTTRMARFENGLTDNQALVGGRRVRAAKERVCGSRIKLFVKKKKKRKSNESVFLRPRCFSGCRFEEVRVHR